jgi:hypothetical protein
MVRSCWATLVASRRAATVLGDSAGFRKTKCRVAVGAPLSVTATKSRLKSLPASSSGLPMVAEQVMY